MDVYHAHVETVALERIPKLFCDQKSKLRVVISTIAFGMGVQIPDIEYIIHWGPSENILMYWQEVGRCARDGRQGSAILYTPPYSVCKAKSSEQMIQYVQDSEKHCLRKFILKCITTDDMKIDDIDQLCGKQWCCSFCDTI